MDLSEGSTGADVVKLQQELKDQGYYTGAIDGIYGSQTEAAVTGFQQHEGLRIDGIAGWETMGALHTLENHSQSYISNEHSSLSGISDGGCFSDNYAPCGTWDISGIGSSYHNETYHTNSYSDGAGNTYQNETYHGNSYHSDGSGNTYQNETYHDHSYQTDNYGNEYHTDTYASTDYSVGGHEHHV